MWFASTNTECITTQIVFTLGPNYGTYADRVLFNITETKENHTADE